MYSFKLINMGHCPRGKKSIPVNKNLYNSTKKKVKSRIKVWPSAYASGQLVSGYKRKGGKYKCAFGSLDRWFKEKWVNVCSKKKVACGRNKSSKNGYPYCRPSVRVNKHTPKTIREIGKQGKLLCRKKRKNPYKKVFVHFGIKKNKTKRYMDKLNNSCGFGYRRKMRFGNNLGKTNSNVDTFYKKGAANSSYLTNGIRKCESIVYGDSILRSNYRFGKKQRFIQDAFKTFEKKGTKGSFTRWCKRQGFPKATTACIARGKKSKNVKIRRKAIFAQNIRNLRVYSFGKKSHKKNYKKISTLTKINSDIKYLQLV